MSKIDQKALKTLENARNVCIKHKFTQEGSISLLSSAVCPGLLTSGVSIRSFSGKLDLPKVCMHEHLSENHEGPEPNRKSEVEGEDVFFSRLNLTKE